MPDSDFGIERRGGATVGLEVKAAAAVAVDDFKGLRTLAGACGRDFHLGVVLYDGGRIVPTRDRFCTAPISCFWA